MLKGAYLENNLNMSFRTLGFENMQFERFMQLLSDPVLHYSLGASTALHLYSFELFELFKIYHIIEEVICQVETIFLVSFFLCETQILRKFQWGFCFFLYIGSEVYISNQLTIDDPPIRVNFHCDFIYDVQKEIFLKVLLQIIFRVLHTSNTQ